MKNTAQRINLQQLLIGDLTRIHIPDVQRDYVMGSGREKLQELLAEMREAAKSNNDFYFSCIVGHKDQYNVLHIYDGQQRLVTLFYLCAYIMQNSVSYKEELQKLSQKFSFSNRETANDWLTDPSKIQVEAADDFTTYSLAQLIQTYNNPPYQNFPPYLLSSDDPLSPDFLSPDPLTPYFLFNKVQFDMVLVEKSSDAEQFFFDLNDGLDLNSYEIFKAELYDHIRKLDEETFKRFALKAENEWLNYFMQIDSNEETKLICFWQYCFRMMWIESHGSAEGFDAQKIDWLGLDEIERLEKIIDKISDPDSHCTNLTSSVLARSKTTLIFQNSYRWEGSIYTGEHWDLTDSNYHSMLCTFIQNIYKTDEINKDILMWCYLSNLPHCADDTLAEYLRFVKKLLNQKRAEHKYGSINFISRGISSKQLSYTRYYVLGIPLYYIYEGSSRFKYHAGSNNFTNTPNPFFYPILLLNKDFISGNNPDFLEVYSENCCDPDLTKILEKEQKKQASKDKEMIEKLENLPFINGLVDNFVSYKENDCSLAQPEDFYNAIFNIAKSFENINRSDYCYKNILKFIETWKIDLQSTLISDIYIQWINYCKTICGKKCAVIPHTWCDLFTSENGICFTQEPLCLNLGHLPDGWIENDREIWQPKDADNKSGFESYHEKHCVWNLDFIKNFSYIQKSDQNSYVIDGIIQDHLPEYLKSYNGNNWIDKIISEYGKVYFHQDSWKNEFLAERYFKFSGEQLDPHSQLSRMYVRKIENFLFFIEISPEA